MTEIRKISWDSVVHTGLDVNVSRTTTPITVVQLLSGFSFVHNTYKYRYLLYIPYGGNTTCSAVYAPYRSINVIPDDRCPHHGEVESQHWDMLRFTRQRSCTKNPLQVSNITSFHQYKHLRTRKSATSCKVEKAGWCNLIWVILDTTPVPIRT